MSSILSPVLFQLGAGGILGFLVGYAVKKVLKILAVIIGLFALALIYLGYTGVIDVNYAKLTEIVENAINSLGQATQYISPIIANLPFAGSFAVGAVLGFKKG